ncbi:hypothetical protein BS78_03G041500 [Paspalum vaginatum]|nr:hypothetical protein BS78_03G041500 [Paspalum vaginatum]
MEQNSSATVYRHPFYSAHWAWPQSSCRGAPIQPTPSVPQPAWEDCRRLPQRLLESGRASTLLAASVLTWRRLASCDPEHALAAFVLWLLGAALASLSLVAALARALRGYLLGGL